MLKSHHKKLNSLLSFVQCNKLFNEKELIKEVFCKINDIHNSEDYTEPLEMYIKKYKLKKNNDLILIELNNLFIDYSVRTYKTVSLV